MYSNEMRNLKMLVFVNAFTLDDIGPSSQIELMIANLYKSKKPSFDTPRMNIILQSPNIKLVIHS